MSMLKVAERHGDGDAKPTRYYSTKQEDGIAKKFDGKRQKNSGATMFDKGDVTLDSVLIEAKTKVSPSSSISVKKEWLEKNEKEALFIGKPYNALAFNFGPDEDNYYIINEEMFGILLNAIKENNNER